MAQQIEIKHSSLSGSIPTTSSLHLGQLAINSWDGKAYIKKNNGIESIVELGTGGGSSTSASYAATSSLPLLGIITASASNTTITFTKGDGSTFNVTVSQSGSVATASYALYAETSSWATNALTASYINPSLIPSPFQIATGSVTASVDVNPNSLFLIKSGSTQYFNVSSSGNVNINSNLFIIKNFTTQQPVLTVSQSIVQFATQSTIPTGTTSAGSIWFTSASMYVGLE